MQTNDENDRNEGTAADAADLVGPGTGGSPTSAASGETRPSPDAGEDPEVAALVEELRRDREDVRVEPREASEETGTGTDR